ALFWNIPDMNGKGIEWSDHIIRSHRGIGYWRKTRSLCVEEIIPKLMQTALDVLEHRKLCKGFLNRVVLARQLSRLLRNPASLLSFLLGAHVDVERRRILLLLQDVISLLFFEALVPFQSDSCIGRRRQDRR